MNGSLFWGLMAPLILLLLLLYNSGPPSVRLLILGHLNKHGPQMFGELVIHLSRRLGISNEEASSKLRCVLPRLMNSGEVEKVLIASQTNLGNWRNINHYRITLKGEDSLRAKTRG